MAVWVTRSARPMSGVQARMRSLSSESLVKKSGEEVEVELDERALPHEPIASPKFACDVGRIFTEGGRR